MGSPIWIERDPDGRPYYVKRKEKQLSTREVIAELFLPLRRRSNPLSRAFRRDHLVVPAGVSTIPVPHPPPPPRPPPPRRQPQDDQKLTDTDPPTNIANTSAQPTQTYPPALFNMFSPSNPPPFLPASHQNNQHNQNGQNEVVRSPLRQPQYNALTVPPIWPPIQAPHQMFPFPNSAMNFAVYPPMYPAMSSPGPTTVPFVLQRMPNTRAGFPTPQTSVSDAMRYKCDGCGRFRSARYHYKHPLMPGQVPGKTTCRRCREAATDSNGESTDSHEDTRTRTRRPHSRRDTKQLSPRTRSKIGRSQSRGPEGRKSTRRVNRPSSNSSSSDKEYERRRNHRRRSPSPSFEVISYVDVSPHPGPSQRTRTVHVDSGRDRHPNDDHWCEEEGSLDTGSSRRNAYRQNVPSSRVVHRQRSDPMMALQHGRDMRHLQEGGIGEYRESMACRPLQVDPRAIQQDSRMMPMTNYADLHDQLNPGHQRQFDGTGNSRNEGGFRYASDSIRGRHVNRHDNYDGGASEETILDQPSTLPFALQAPPGLGQRARHSSLPATPQSPSCPRYTVQMSDRHGDGGRERVRTTENYAADYDWYDDHGMRVRVREI